MEAPSQNGRERSSSAAQSNNNSHFAPDPTNSNRLHTNQSLSGTSNSDNNYLTTTSTSNQQFLFTTPYLTATSQDGLGFTTNVTAPERSFNQQEDFSQTFDTNFLDSLEHSTAGVNDSRDSQPFPEFDNSDHGFNFDEFSTFTHQDQTSGFNTSNAMMSTIQQPTINPADFAQPLSSPQMPTSPHLIPPETVSSPNRPASPAAASSPGTFYTPQHSRHTSLDPASAAYISTDSQSNWHGILGNSSFRGHRRAPSEHSDVSSVSHSPFLPQHDTFDNSAHPSAQPSPRLPPQADPRLYDNAFGMEAFTISERDQNNGYSPAHSPYISPRLSPQLHNTDLDPDSSLLLAQHIPRVQGTQDPYAGTSAPPVPGFQAQAGLGDMGQAAQMTPPSINVEFAPPSRTSTVDAPKLNADGDTLSPPISRARGRSKSDPFMSRPMSPSSLGASLGGTNSNAGSLSPSLVPSGTFSTPSSREVSPVSKNRRQSTSSLDSRSYILDLANPQRPGSNPQDSKRVQKHPATFQCTLCPKKFTRAYNLRSHLRTHTDERPFVCTICGRAFARQHDRRRHESLHSGERRFVCRGDMSSGRQWGCGRRFARADALGRHFRSEAGRVCIKPLLDEEALERDALNQQQQQQQQQQQGSTSPGHLQPNNQPLTIPGMDGHGSSFTLPAALLAQYPALQGLQWDQIAPPVDDNSDIGGRSSFDASSGGEFGFGDEEDPVNTGYLNQPSGQPQQQQQQQLGAGQLNPGPAGSGWPQSGQAWTNEYNSIR
ncbi:DNA-binding transcription factor [Microsporum canis]|uniref:C2H2 type zinc finger domain-containing protein n=1 Tax=Arthroderma otae (strain ATCC MYA-4605 / CBS 113480) TaxID=554155 RepID=C5FEV8_ARTOC|nr:C2H2 type zinc finger domain-containing protein [Microsporum canis CBS 113480]EEQ28252.1 C2H2 type zinc finger domain-containing protein [Microsporum canis CBS 113480]